MSEPTQEINNGVQVYRRLLGYVLPYKAAFALASLGLIIGAAADTYLATLIKPLIDGVFVEQDGYWIRLIPLLLLVVALVRASSTFLANFLMSWIGRHVIKTLRRQVFDQLLRLPSSFYDHNSTGKLMSKMSYDVEQVAQAATQAITVLIRDTLTVIGLLSWMFYLSWKLTLIFLLISPVIATLVIIVNRRFRRISTRLQDSMGGVAYITEEAIAGQRVIKIFGGQASEQKRFEHVNERNRSQFMKLVATREGSIQVNQVIAGIALAVIVYLATMPDMLEVIGPGTFMSFITAMMMMMSPIKRLTTINAEVQKGIAAANSIFMLLDTPVEPDDGQQSLLRAQGRLDYRHVSFSYGRGDVVALDDINLTIEAGQTVAFVGHSGSGKTTLVNLLPRFFRVGEGVIELDGCDITAIRLTDLRRQVALVGQDVVLFNDSIAANICYGEELDPQRLLAAAKAAHALAFIEQMPEGMDTKVGEKGVLLSGGQRQRLAIARALYKDAPLLILDEATSALDSESERHIQQALEGLIKGRTTLVIAHRLSTIQQADQIVVLHEGRILETGRHDELLARDGHYARLYRVQFNDIDAAS